MVGLVEAGYGFVNGGFEEGDFTDPPILSRVPSSEETISSFSVGSKEKEVTVFGDHSNPKGLDISGYGPPVLFRSGGPDVFGYKWIDSDETGGPTYNWIDITSIGTRITGIGDDNNRGPFPIGFDFPFYGNTFDTFRFCTNGFISFTSSSAMYTNTNIPNTSAPYNLIAPFWDDLDFEGQGSAYYYSNGIDTLVISYINVQHYPTTNGPYTFQIILKRNGTIYFQYQDMNSPLYSATIGIQNQNGTDGLQVVYNTYYVHDGLAIMISSGPLIEVTPTSGPVGTLVTVEGQNFATQTQISISFGTIPTITTTTSSASGTFSVTFLVSTQSGGTKIITARDSLGNQFTIPFCIKPNASCFTERGQNQGRVGDTISIEGSGVGGQGLVRIDFGTQLSITTTISSGNGTFTASFKIPPQPGGTKIITIYGSIVTVSFYIQADTSVSPPSGEGPVGTLVYIAGTGASASSLIVIDFGTHPTITTTTTNTNGTFSTSFTVDTQGGGTTLVTIRGYGPAPFTDTIPFRILGSVIFLYPTQGPPSTTVTIQGIGFRKQGLVRIDFGTHLTITTITSSVNGTFSTTFIVDNQPIGTKIITVTDQLGNFDTAIFVITPSSPPPPPPSLSGIITVIGTPTEVYPGGTVTYTITYLVNKLPKQLQIHDLFNSNQLEFATSTPAPTFPRTGELLIWIIDNLGAKEGTITIFMRLLPSVTPGETITTAAFLYGDNQPAPLFISIFNIYVGTPTIAPLPKFAKDNNSCVVYPNPYKKGNGRFIYFGNVSQEAVIKIYNITGELVKEIEVTKPLEVWNIDNEKIASGVYIYTVTGGGGGKSVGKIEIVK